MGVTFTAEQQQVIDLRNRNILVSAAAGSGKTAVLVERIITRLTKDENPLNVDELLIVTFTEAAAAEMKERIGTAIEKALEQEPENVHLQQQATLVHQAQITTIHKFCTSVIKENFHTIDLDPVFRVGEEGELKLLQKDVVCEVLEQAFQEGSSDFLSFVECFAAGKDDKDLEEQILRLYEFSRSYPKPEVWLDSCVEQYEVESAEELEQKPYVKELLAEVRGNVGQLRNMLEFAIQICMEKEGPVAYIEALTSDLEQISCLEKAENFAEMKRIITHMEWKSLGSNKGKVVDEQKQKRAKSIRDEVKNYIKKLAEQYFFGDLDVMVEDLAFVRGNMETLIHLVKQFAEQYAEEKRAKKLIDFSDMEQYALKILTREENGALVPSEVAEGYQQKFAEVMIDEYQDSNYVQEAILTSVSGVSKGRYNVFMVGDVKQSIYRFRLSRPELFMSKFNSYSTQDSKMQRIDLHKNFRSRREVLDSTNFLFRQIMTPGLGGIDYDDRAALYVGASYEEQAGNDTELLLAEVPESRAKERIEIEAELIAKRVKQLMKEQVVLDKKTEEYRPLSYKDIVILTRSAKGWTETFSKVLGNAGIPVYACSKTGYFETTEIQSVMHYLQVLDNPRQDIPFTAALTSMFAGLNSEELAILRSSSEGETMYDCACHYAEHGEGEALKRRLGAFLHQLEDFREKIPYTAIHVLLRQILEDTGYGDYVAALPGGEQRAANLEMLVEKAVTFEGTSYKGLFNFVRYIEQLKKYAVDYGEADVLEENADVVNLMTIHKSKGLEFPVVFVAGTGKGFNFQDMKNKLVLHSELGVGMEAIDPVARTKSPTLLKIVIQWKETKETISEELRVLYVAMTRAKEKLILTGVVENLEKELEVCQLLETQQKEQIPYYYLSKARKYLDWILPAVCSKKDAADLPFTVRHFGLEELAEQEAAEQIAESLTKEILQQWDTEQVYDESIRQQLQEQLSYVYPFEQNQAVKQKVSVSELKKRDYMEEEVSLLLPKFLEEEASVSGASKGTAYHRLLELLDFTKEYDEDTLEQAIQSFTKQGVLEEDMAACIRRKEILRFLWSPLGKRLQQAGRKGQIHMEQPFVLGVDAGRIYPESHAGGDVLVQGIVDVYFEEDGQLVVLDYKTDKVSQDSQLIERYHTQLAYYAEALERLTGKRVKEKVIYSFWLQKTIILE